MAKICVFPLPGHSMLTAVQESRRSSHELLGISPDKCRTTEVEADLVLAHPPVLWINAGGGEQLLNRDAVNSQLSHQQRGRHGNERPAHLRCWVIDQDALNKDAKLRQLYAFLFGPIQNLFYQKKQGGKSSWKIVMHQVEKDEYLKNTIEQHLFDGDVLAPRHYKKLLSAAQVGESSINQELGKIRSKKSKNNAEEKTGVIIEKSSAVATTKSNEENEKSGHESPAASTERKSGKQEDKQEKLNIKESFANIKRASENAMVQFPSHEKTIGEEDV